MARIAIIEADGKSVQAVVIGEPADFPGAIVVPDGLPVGPGTKVIDGAFDVEPVPEPVPAGRELTRMEFVNHLQTAGGTTDALLVAAHADANLAALWIKLQLSVGVDRDDPNTLAGLGGLEALGYLPNGAAAVIAAWPVIG